MADNVVLNAGAGGDTVGAKDVGGIKYQQILVLAPATATLSRVATSGTSATLLSSNADRRHFLIVNESATATLYVKFGVTASATDYTIALGPMSLYESPIGGYTGRVDAVLSTGSSNAQVTELT
jgi:hypothetical protein